METYCVCCAPSLSDVDAVRIGAELARFGGGGFHWLREGYALEILLQGEPEALFFRHFREDWSSRGVDVFLVPAVNRRKKLFLADMDATIVIGETLDEMADLAGLGDEVSCITQAAMRGELDFVEALSARVLMLENLPVSLLERTFSGMVLSGGAETLVQTMEAHGTRCVLVSGGFDYFTSRVSGLCGFSAHHGNVLEVSGDVLTGRVVPPVLDKDAKLGFLKRYVREMGLEMVDTMAVGDGANDVPMLMAAGVGVGYHPKPLVREQVRNYIVHSDLLSLLYIQGYHFDEIAPYMKS